MRLRKLFTKEADRRADAALTEVAKSAQATTESSKKLHRLLKQNGVILQISIATGHHGGR